MSKARRPLPVSYVLRLYRADPSRLDAVAGLLEDVLAGRTMSFKSGTELLRQLQAADRPADAPPPVPPADTDPV